MTIGTAMLAALLMLIFILGIVAIILGITWLLLDHPFILGIVTFILLWGLATLLIYIGGITA